MGLPDLLKLGDRFWYSVIDLSNFSPMTFPFSLRFSSQSALQILSTKFYPTNFVFNLFLKIQKKFFLKRYSQLVAFICN